MAYGPKRSEAMANAACNAMVDTLNTGTIKIYTVGSGVPATVATAIGDQTLLATLTLAATAFGDAAAGVATAGTITSDTSADNAGTASFFRILNSGATACFQGLVGTTGCDLNLNTTTFTTGATVSISSLTITEPLE